MTDASPGGEYGAGQPPYGGAASSGINYRSVNPLDWGTVAAGVLALIFSFFSYYDYSYKGRFKDACGSDCSRTTSAWSGFFGWFAVLLAIVGAALIAITVLTPQVRLPFPARLTALGAYVLGVVFTLLALPVVPNYQGASGREYDRVIDEGHAFSYWIVLILIAVGAVLTYRRFQQTGGNFAALFNRSKPRGGQS